ncbi:MAG: hypothetical protein HY554_00800 [Elusimicrobia bacterium]|nr:hypothetical protein [Elusimicrobiota bacterium]
MKTMTLAGLFVIVASAAHAQPAQPRASAPRSVRSYECGRLHGLHDSILLLEAMPDERSDADFWMSMALLRARNAAAIMAGVSGWEIDPADAFLRERLNRIALALRPRPIDYYNPVASYWRWVIEIQRQAFEKVRGDVHETAEAVCARR